MREAREREREREREKVKKEIERREREKRIKNNFFFMPSSYNKLLFLVVYYS